MTPLARDAFRAARRNPVLSGLAVLTLAVGMTITVAAFSLIDGLLLRPLPIASPSTLIQIQSTANPPSGHGAGVSFDDFRDIRQRTEQVAEVAAFRGAGVAVRTSSEPVRLENLGVVSTNYFSLLGVEPVIGRIFGDADARGPQDPPAVISHQYWTRQFGRDRTVVGRTIRLNSRAWTIVGVLPPGFAGTRPVLSPAIWVPAEAEPNDRLGNRGDRSFDVFGRLRPGATIEPLRSELQSLGAALAARYPATHGGRTLAAEFESSVRLRELRVIAAIAVIFVSLPLLIGCANVMGLLLGRAEARRAEIATRLALGATRPRLICQLLVETALLAAAAAAASLLLALGTLRLIPALLPPLPIDLNLDFRIDMRVVIATCGLAFAAALLAGLAPALTATRANLATLIKAQPVMAAGRRFTFRNVLVAGQIAVMFLLLQLAAVFALSLHHAGAMAPDFAPGAMAFATVAPGAAGYASDRSQDFFSRLMERASRHPAIEAAAFARHVPLNALYGSGRPQGIAIPGHEPPSGQTAIAVPQNLVSSGYFETIGIPLLQGRDFDARDRYDGERVTIVNETMARTFWPGESAIGRRIYLLDSADRQSCTIVGVVKDSKYLTLREAPSPYMYFALSQRRAGEITVIVRGRGNEATLAGALRQLIAEVDPDVPVADILTQSEHMRRSLFVERSLVGFVTALGGISLMLAAIGVYGVVAFAVSRRTREIGIEMALGATATRIRRSVLALGAALTGAGAAIGAIGAMGVTAVLANSLYGVTATDPRMFLAAAAVTFPVALAASYLPARRASRINPIAALRE